MFRKIITALCTVCMGVSSLALFPGTELSANAAEKALWPVDEEYNEISTYFDPNRNNGNLYGGHNAIDIPADRGANIYAPVGGKCVVADYMGDYGNLIVLWHEDLGVYTFYAHLDSFTIYEDKYVAPGEVIGHVGNTGNSYGAHLHFGVCDTLIAGYPDLYYHDPLTFFEYGDSTDITVPTPPPAPPVSECSCTDEYAGVYTTKDVNDYLNIRSGHGTDFGIVGRIDKDDEFIVTKADGKWAHVENNGVSGYCSMEFIQRVKTAESFMTIEGERVPDREIAYGMPYSIGGVISSAANITRVTGGVYTSDGATPVYVCEDYPNKLTYDLRMKFDNEILFNKISSGNYIYKIEAEDENGTVFELINTNFSVVSTTVTATGDLNGDGNVTIADAVLLERYLLGKAKFLPEQVKAADLTGDSVVDVYDMILIRKIMAGNLL